MRHKWGGKVGYGKDNSSVGCVNCDCVRQYVGGKVTYFLNDNVTDKAPPCPGEIKPAPSETFNPRFNR